MRLENRSASSGKGACPPRSHRRAAERSFAHEKPLLFPPGTREAAGRTALFLLQTREARTKAALFPTKTREATRETVLFPSKIREATRETVLFCLKTVLFYPKTVLFYPKTVLILCKTSLICRETGLIPRASGLILLVLALALLEFPDAPRRSAIRDAFLWDRRLGAGVLGRGRGRDRAAQHRPAFRAPLRRGANVVAAPGAAAGHRPNPRAARFAVTDRGTDASTCGRERDQPCVRHGQLDERRAND